MNDRLNKALKQLVMDISVAVTQEHTRDFKRMEMVNRATDEALAQIKQYIREEIIGEDDEQDTPEAMRDPENNGRNQLRATQREKL